MVDLENFNVNGIANPDNNIFGLPFSYEDAKLVILPVPWEVTVSYGSGTARCFDGITKASYQIDLFNKYYKDTWKEGFFMKELDKNILMKSDYLRKEAELYVDFIATAEDRSSNEFMTKALRDVNEGSIVLNDWVYDQAKQARKDGKILGLLGGDHSTPFGYIKALSEEYDDFGIIQIDAHCDLRKAYEDFVYSHASIMYNVLNEIKEVSHLTQVGVRDYCEEEWDFVNKNNKRVDVFFDEDIKEQIYKGEHWQFIVSRIVDTLPENVYISFDIDGLDFKLCPNTGTPVYGGFEVDQIIFLFKKISETGRRIIGFDLVEVGTGDSIIDASVGARLLWNLCNLTVQNNLNK